MLHLPLATYANFFFWKHHNQFFPTENLWILPWSNLSQLLVSILSIIFWKYVLICVILWLTSNSLKWEQRPLLLVEFCSPFYSQGLVKLLEYNRCTLNMCWIRLFLSSRFVDSSNFFLNIFICSKAISKWFYYSTPYLLLLLHTHTQTTLYRHT